MFINLSVTLAGIIIFVTKKKRRFSSLKIETLKPYGWSIIR